MNQQNRMIGEKIRSYRAFRGIKQQNLASTVGVSRVTLSKYENGKTEISFVLLSLIAIALDIDLDQLITASKN